MNTGWGADLYHHWLDYSNILFNKSEICFFTCNRTARSAIVSTQVLCAPRLLSDRRLTPLLDCVPRFLSYAQEDRLSSWTVLRGLLSGVSSVDRSEEKTAWDAEKAGPVPDEILMQRVQSGDKDAVAALYDRHSRLILSVGLRILRDVGEAQELLQDVFVYVFQKSSNFDPTKSSVRSWVLQIAYSRALNKREYLTLRRFYDYRQIDDAVHAVSSDLSPERMREISEIRELLESAFGMLSGVQRTTLQMFFWQGYSLREISDQLKETVGNTRHHYYRALETLREVLKPSVSSCRNRKE